MRFPTRANKLFITAALSLLPCFAACDNDDDDIGTGGSGNEQTAAQVVSVSPESAAVAVAGSVGLNIDFTFAREQVDDNDRNVIIKVSLPGGVRYQDNSAGVDGRTQDDDVDPEAVEPCANNATVLTFNLDENDLTNVDDPPGIASARLKLALVGIAPGAATIGANAAYDVNPGSCAGLSPDAVGTVTVTP